MRVDRAGKSSADDLLRAALERTDPAAALALDEVEDDGLHERRLTRAREENGLVDPLEPPVNANGNHRPPSALTPSDVLAEWGRRGPLVHEPTGLDWLDERTGGGLPYGTRCYVLGAPDAGKTALMIELADSYVSRGVPVGILAIDEEPGDIVDAARPTLGIRS